MQGVEIDALGIVRYGVAVGNDEIVLEAETLQDAVFSACISYDVHLSRPEFVPGMVVVEREVLDSCFVETGGVAHLVFLSQLWEIAECQFGVVVQAIIEEAVALVCAEDVVALVVLI